MHGVSVSTAGLPATTVIHLSANRPVPRPARANAAAGEALLAGLRYPPRTAEACQLSALMPQVLARYGIEVPRLTDGTCPTEHFEAVA